MFRCDANSYQQWEYDPSRNNLLDGPASGKCLSIVETGNVVMEDCWHVGAQDYATNRSWEFTDQGLIHALGSQPPMCLKLNATDNLHSDTNIGVTDCNVGDPLQHLIMYKQVRINSAGLEPGLGLVYTTVLTLELLFSYFKYHTCATKTTPCHFYFIFLGILILKNYKENVRREL